MKTSIIKCLGIFAVAGTLLTAGDTEAKVVIKKSTSYYIVSGSTGVAIAKALITKGPKQTSLRHAIASTQWGYDFGKPKFGVRGRKCVIEDIRITVKVKYTIPRWKGSKKASTELRKNWKDFSKLIVAHEDKHGAIAVQGARDLEKEIKRLTGNVSRECKDFGRFAKLRFTNLHKSIVRKQRAFDRRERFALSKIARAQKKLLRSN